MKPRIYLDHAATSPLRPEARAAMEEGFALWANPSSPHAEGRKAKQALEDARDRIKKALSWDGELIFTSGASEALCIALNKAKVDRRIVSAVEHDAVFRAAPDAEVMPIVGGSIAEAPLRQLVAGGPRAIIVVQQINSETGTIIAPYQGSPLATSIRKSGHLILSDCSQGVPKYELPDCDLAVVASHKFGGPVGIGALLVRDFNFLKTVGGHERGYRQGTESLPQILGMAAAIEMGGIESWAVSPEELFDFYNAVYDGGDVLMPGVQSAHIRALVHPTMSAQALLIRLDAMGFAVSAGSACSSGTLKKSRVLDAFGVPDDVAARTIRVSIGWSTTPDELEQFAEAWRSLA